MAKKLTKQINSQYEPTYVQLNDGTIIPQYSFGDWLQENSAAIGTVAGATIGSIIPGAGTAAGASIGGAIGGAVQGNYAKEEGKRVDKNERGRQVALQNTANFNKNIDSIDNLPVYAKGGTINYQGNSHENGGILVDKQGNPVSLTKQKPVAEVENNEVAWHTPQGNVYIFSDKLGYADKAKKIINKYSKRLGKDLQKSDPLAKAGLDRQLSELMEQQEAKKAPDMHVMPDGEVMPGATHQENTSYAHGGHLYSNEQSIPKMKEGGYHAVKASETTGDDPKYPINSASDVKDAWHLRNHAKGLKISKETLKNRIKRKAGEYGVDLIEDKANGGNLDTTTYNPDLVSTTDLSATQHNELVNRYRGYQDQLNSTLFEQNPDFKQTYDQIIQTPAAEREELYSTVAPEAPYLSTQQQQNILGKDYDDYLSSVSYLQQQADKDYPGLVNLAGTKENVGDQFKYGVRASTFTRYNEPNPSKDFNQTLAEAKDTSQSLNLAKNNEMTRGGRLKKMQTGDYFDYSPTLSDYAQQTQPFSIVDTTPTVTTPEVNLFPADIGQTSVQPSTNLAGGTEELGTNRRYDPTQSSQPYIQKQFRTAALGNIASALTGAIGAATTGRDRMSPMTAATVTPEQIDYSASRQALQRAAELSRAENRRRAATSGLTGSQYSAASTAGDLASRRAEGQQLGTSFEREANKNAMLRQQANMANMQARQAANRANAYMESRRIQAEDARRRQIAQALQTGITGVTKAYQQKFQDFQGAETMGDILEAYRSRTGYTPMYDEQGNMILTVDPNSPQYKALSGD